MTTMLREDDPAPKKAAGMTADELKAINQALEGVMMLGWRRPTDRPATLPSGSIKQPRNAR
jgi:hypothetical protein